MENKEEFKEKYILLKEKYGLPTFIQLAEDFDIEKIMEVENSFLLREIRRTIHEKLSAYLQLFETLLNPVSPPMFIFSILRGIGSEEKEKIKEIYKKLSKLQLFVMRLDTFYKEENEANYVKDSFSDWQDIKHELTGLIKKLEEGLEQNNDPKKGGYLG
jgi:hypothetical protein